jgi:hypothetical protein
VKYGFDLGRLEKYMERSVALEHFAADYSALVRFRAIGS